MVNEQANEEHQLSDRTMITDDEISEWTRLCDEATAGPWYATDANYDGSASPNFSAHGVWTVSLKRELPGWSTDSGCPGYGIQEQDARLIATARTALPRLLAERGDRSSDTSAAVMREREECARIAEAPEARDEEFLASRPDDERDVDQRDAAGRAVAAAIRARPVPDPSPDARETEHKIAEDIAISVAMTASRDRADEAMYQDVFSETFNRTIRALSRSAPDTATAVMREREACASLAAQMSDGSNYWQVAAAIRARPSPEPPASPWQPIESAPKDGTIIDVWLGGATVDDVLYYCTEGTRRSPAWSWQGGKWRPSGGLHLPTFIKPTLWMPLPAPPEIEEKGT